METTLQNDVVALSRIEAVQMILKTLNDITGLRVSLVARVTEDSWTACAVHDDANFGIEPGNQLDLWTTY